MQLLHVFGGPSTSWMHTFHSPHICRHPPVVAGSLEALKESSCFKSRDISLLVDGEFGLAQAISLQEIRQFIEAGCSLVGCTSLGALRAVEARSIGMTGTGEIYYDYLIGKRYADSDVAVPTCENGKELGPSTIDLDYLPQAAWEIFDIRVPYPVMDRLKQTHYAERTFPVVAEALQVAGMSTGQAHFLVHGPGRSLWAMKRLDSFRAINQLLLEISYGRGESL